MSEEVEEVEDVPEEVQAESRPMELFSREPIAMNGTKWVSHPFFLRSATMQTLLKGIDLNDDLTEAILCFVFFCSSPTSPYQETTLAERIGMVISDRLTSEGARMIKGLIKADETRVQKALTWYQDMVMTRSERLFKVLNDQVDEFIERLSTPVKTDKEFFSAEKIIDAIKRGQEMQEMIKRMKAYLRDESSKRTRGDYEPRMFEDRQALMDMQGADRSPS